jgi:diguanylate cyclase
MESENSGIELIKWVREQESLAATRLVLRTGHPGSFYEEELVQNLDINDYWPKTEPMANRMRTILIGLIRSYRDILHANKKLSSD